MVAKKPPTHSAASKVGGNYVPAEMVGGNGIPTLGRLPIGPTLSRRQCRLRLAN
jgi:hypothetical protein